MGWASNFIVVVAVLTILGQFIHHRTPPSSPDQAEHGDGIGPRGDEPPETTTTTTGAKLKPGTFIPRVGAYVGELGLTIEESVSKKIQQDQELLLNVEMGILRDIEHREAEKKKVHEEQRRLGLLCTPDRDVSLQHVDCNITFLVDVPPNTTVSLLKMLRENHRLHHDTRMLKRRLARLERLFKQTLDGQVSEKKGHTK